MNSRRKIRAKVHRLVELMKDKSAMLIVMQNNPDPDSIGAAVGLRRFANAVAGISCSIAHSGTVGRGENRALVRYLELNLRDFRDISLDRFDLVAMVDAQPATGNSFLPEGVLPDIVFDHHPMRRLTRDVEFTDIRSRCGATSTIILQYLMERQIEIDPPTATALFYGVRSDTQDLGRDATQADIEAIQLLYPLANKRMLSRIQRGKVERNYFQMLSNALKNARVYGNAVVTGLGRIENPDMVAEVADMLLRDDEALWIMSYGFFDDQMLISLRTLQESIRADAVMHSIIARRGTGGGHQSYAGGQIPLGDKSAKDIGRLEAAITGKFLRAVGIEQKESEPLIRR